MLPSPCGWDHLWILLLKVLVWQIINFLTFLIIFRQFSLHATSLTFWLWLGPPVDSAPLCSSLTEPRRPPVALQPPQRQHVPPALIIERICHGSKIGFVSKVICGFVTAGCRHFSLSLTCVCPTEWHVPWEMEQTEKVTSRWQWWWWKWRSFWRWWPPPSSRCLVCLAEKWALADISRGTSSVKKVRILVFLIFWHLHSRR